MNKLYEYWLDSHIIRPAEVRHIIGYRVVNAIFGKYFAYMLEHEQLKGQVTHYKKMWKTSNKNHDATLRALHIHVDHFGELPEIEFKKDLSVDGKGEWWND